jgi:hypothetical protein
VEVDVVSDLESRIIAAHRALPEDIRSAPATADELAAFEAQLGPIPAVYRWYLAHCGGGVAGSEWLDDIGKLAESHRKFERESGEGGWRMRDVFIIGWDGAGNPIGISTKTGEVLVEDHNFGGIHVVAPSFHGFLARAMRVSTDDSIA